MSVPRADRAALKADVLRRYATGEPIYEIQNTSGLPQGTISHWLREAPRRIKRRAWRFDRAEALAVLRQHGLDEAARRYGARYARHLAQAEGIPVPPAHSGPPSDWKPEWDAGLGHEPDFVIASRLGVSAVVVTNRRLALGIGRVAVRDYKRAKIATLSNEDLMRGSPAEVASQAGLADGTDLVKSERRARGLTGPAQVSPDVMQRAAVAGMLMAALDRDGAQADIARVLKVSRERARQLCNEVRATLARATGETP